MARLPERQIVAIDKLHPAAYNPRKDLKPGDPEYDHLANSIEAFGYIEPIVWNKRSGNVVGGHQRLKVLIERGETDAEVVVVDYDETTERAANLALNKIRGDWDFPKLADLLTELDTGAFDLELTGFSEGELKNIMGWTPGGNDVPDPLSDDTDYGGNASMLPGMTYFPFVVPNERAGEVRAWLTAKLGEEPCDGLTRGERLLEYIQREN